MSTSMIRVPDELKEKIEQMREQFGKKTQYEMIEHLIEMTERQKRKITEMQGQLEEQRGKHAEQLETFKQQHIPVRGDVKVELSGLAADLDLAHDDTIAFLMANYGGLSNVSKQVLMTYIDLKKRR